MLRRILFVLPWIIAGCYRSTEVGAAPTGDRGPLVLVDAFDVALDDRAILGVSSAPSGLHLTYGRGFAYSDERAPSGIFGLTSTGTIAYEHRVPIDVHLDAPLSDAQGRPVVLATLRREVEVDFGAGPVTYPEPYGRAGVVVQYEADGALRQAVPVYDAEGAAMWSNDFDVAPDGTVVVCGVLRGAPDRGFVRVIDANGVTLSTTSLPEPITTPGWWTRESQCAIDDAGYVLYVGPLGELDDPHVGLGSRAITLLSPDLEPMGPPVRFAAEGWDIATDPRGYFVLTATFNDFLAVDELLEENRAARSAHVLVTIDRRGRVTLETILRPARTDRDAADVVGKPLDPPPHDAFRAFFRYAYQREIHDRTGELVASDTGVVSALYFELDDEGEPTTPYSMTYPSQEALPDFSTYVGELLWLVDARERRLFVERYRWQE